MTSTLREDAMKQIAAKTSTPIVLREFVSSWSMCQWDVAKWISIFGDKEVPFRCMKRSTVSDEPCWERRCVVKKMMLREFVKQSSTSGDWMYFDYKYLHQWFDADSEIYKELNWKKFGFPDKGANDTSLWIGSCGAHTPAHQDTYGVNLVAQLYGRKRWFLFPPETGYLKPTRVPYEESSVYSELNFYCPSNTQLFNGLSGCRVVELSRGDALLVPRGWWHYVQNIDEINITMNTWIPHENDLSAQVSEALIKIFVAQVCKDLPEKTAKIIVNPNEDDLSETPLAVLFLELETVAKALIERKRKSKRMKRRKTVEESSLPEIQERDIHILVNNPANNIEIPAVISSAELVNIIKENIKQCVSSSSVTEEDEVDGSINSMCLTKAVIDAFSQSNVIDVVKNNLLTRLNDRLLNQ